MHALLMSVNVLFKRLIRSPYDKHLATVSRYYYTFKRTCAVSRFLPQARTRGLFVEQKQMLWRMSRAECFFSPCLPQARSVNISRAPRSFIIICWPSSSKEMFSSSWSHWDRITAAGLLLLLLPLTRGIGRDRKCCRKLLCIVGKKQKGNKTMVVCVWDACHLRFTIMNVYAGTPNSQNP